MSRDIPQQDPLKPSSYSIRIRTRKGNKKCIVLPIIDDQQPHPQFKVSLYLKSKIFLRDFTNVKLFSSKQGKTLYQVYILSIRGVARKYFRGESRG